MEECIALPLDFQELLPPPTRPATAPESSEHCNVSTTATATEPSATNNQSVPTYHLYSRFWRDRQVFDVVADEVLWNICVDRVHEWRGSHFDGVLRAWHAGSSTGEEVYSLSMMWEYHYKRLQKHIAPLQLQILGTDRSMKAIEAAKAATYTCHSLHDLPQPLFNHYTEDVVLVPSTMHGNDDDTTTSTPPNTDYFPPGTEPVGHYTRSGRKGNGGGFGGQNHKDTKAILTKNVTKRCRFLQQDFNREIPENEGPFDIIFARYSVLLYSKNGIEIIASIIQKKMLRPGGYLIVGMSDNISPQVANWLHLIPVKPHVSKGMYQYLPPEWTPMRMDKPTQQTIGQNQQQLPTLSSSPNRGEKTSTSTNHSTNQQDADALLIEDYLDLSHFLSDGLHQVPPEMKHNYITEGSEKILSRMKVPYANRPPLHHVDRLPLLRDRRDLDQEDALRWDRTLNENAFGGDQENDYYRKEKERMEKKRKDRKKILPLNELNSIVDRMMQDAQKKEQKRIDRMKQMWKDEKKKFKTKRKNERKKRKRQLRKLKIVKNPARLEEEEEEEIRERESSNVTGIDRKSIDNNVVLVEEALNDDMANRVETEGEDNVIVVSKTSIKKKRKKNGKGTKGTKGLKGTKGTKSSKGSKGTKGKKRKGKKKIPKRPDTAPSQLVKVKKRVVSTHRRMHPLNAK